MPANRAALARTQDLLSSLFPGLSNEQIEKIPRMLRNPVKYKFRPILYIAEGRSGEVQGFALLLHEPDLRFCYLDYLASDKRLSGRGIGGALYERVREEAEMLDVTGVFFECLPDSPALCRNEQVLKQNKARLRFYESYGARPIINTAYETPVTAGGDNPPYLVVDDLGQDIELRADYVKKVIKAILKRKYKHVCTPEFIQMVLDSVKDDPVRLRPPQYSGPRQTPPPEHVPVPSDLRKIVLIVNDRHEIHHVRDRGYVEAPVRIRTILNALERTRLFDQRPPLHFEDKWLTAVHSVCYINYLKRICEKIKPTESVYPYVFPIRNAARPPVDLPVRAGYYCMDTFTPISRNAFLAARRAVDCALTGADEILAGRRIAYALVRPPGHHAEHGFFGGFCYFNNAAVAANYLSGYGHVAMLDIDYHHGNGQQIIFYDRNDVLTVSIHGHPRFAFPYFSGFHDERGSGSGTGFNVNLPLAEDIDGPAYLEKLEQALARIRRFKPVYLVVCLGLDTAKGDPTGSWSLRGKDFNAVGGRIAALGVPVLVVQEGGYDNRSIGANAAHFFTGLAAHLGNRPAAVNAAPRGRRTEAKPRPPKQTSM